MPLKKTLAKNAFSEPRQLLLEGCLLKTLSRSLARVSFVTPRFWAGQAYPAFGWLSRAGRRIPARLTGWWAGRAYYTIIGTDQDFFLARCFWRPLAPVASRAWPTERPARISSQSLQPWAGPDSAPPGLNYLLASQVEAWGAAGVEAIKAALAQKLRVLVLTPSLPWLTALLSAGGHWPVSPVYLAEADESGPLAAYAVANEAHRLSEEARGRLAEAQARLQAHTLKKEALRAELAKYAELKTLEDSWRNLSHEALKLTGAGNAHKAVVSGITASWQEIAAEYKRWQRRWWWPLGRKNALAEAAEEGRRLKDELEAAEFQAGRLRAEQLALLEQARKAQKTLESCQDECDRSGSFEALQKRFKVAESVSLTLAEWQRRAQVEACPAATQMARLLNRGRLVLAHSGHLEIGELLGPGQFDLLVAIGPTDWLQKSLAWDQLIQKAPQALIIDVRGRTPDRAGNHRLPGGFFNWLGLKESHCFQAPWKSSPPVSWSYLPELKHFAWPRGKPGLALNLAAAYWAVSAAGARASGGPSSGYIFCSNRPQARLTERLLADFGVTGCQALTARIPVGEPSPAGFIVIDDLAWLAAGVALTRERLAVLANRSWLKRRLRRLPGAEAWNDLKLESAGVDDLNSGPGSWRALPELASLAKEELLIFLPPPSPHFWPEARMAFLGCLKRGVRIRLLTALLDRDPESEYASGALKELSLSGLNLIRIAEAPWPQAVIDRQHLAWAPLGEAGPGRLWLTFPAPGAAAFWQAAVSRRIWGK